MSIINEKYQILAPKLQYLKDEVILSQAWKKSNSYIRRHNWYADILELDCTVVDLEKKLEQYALDLSEGSTYKPDPLRVILAPKNKKWVFPDDDKKSWLPAKGENNKTEQPLRPLAHISIRDQTVNTAIMLCIADAVESVQGPTEESDFIKAQQEQIYSYGNRLHCEWISHFNKKRQARFSWGSSKSYRQYFDDYKRFLKRPQNVCNYYESTLPPNKELYVVSLDLSKFYNHIDLNLLVEELKYLYREYVDYYNFSQEYKDEELFWKKVKEIFKWEWTKSDYTKNNNIIENAKSSLGLPQGLVASGFFANAYLIRFDRMVGEYLKENLKKNQKEEIKKGRKKLEKIEILDYCRYVDDIRLVVEVSGNIKPEIIEKKVSRLIKCLLKQHLMINLKRNKEKDIDKEKIIDINEKKTSIVSFRQLSNKSNISAVMNTIQHGISGTPDADSLQQIIGELFGLLRMSDALEGEGIKKGNELELSRIYLPHMDIRDETLKRFSATRLVKTLRFKKSMTVHNEQVAINETGTKVMTASQMLEHEFETVARKLISSWAENPSLSLLLKCGFELYPDVTLLYPVLEALELKLFDKSVSPDEIKTAEYVISDLLRAASTSIGYKPGYVYPESVNLNGFREELAAFAKKLVSTEKHFPWYVKQQAILFLITNGDYGFSIDEDQDGLNLYELLHDSSLYRIKGNNKILDRLSTSLIAQQLNPNREKYATWFIDWINNLNDDNYKKQVLQMLLTNRPDLLSKVLLSSKTKKSNWRNFIPSSIRIHLTEKKGLNFNSNLKGFVSLMEVIGSKNNPFKQENALLNLTKAILEDPHTLQKLNEGWGVADIRISCKNWNGVQNPSCTNLSIKWNEQREENTFNLFQPPSWIRENFKWMYTLGAILRACLTGEYDFTSNTFLHREDIGVYRGIKSTSYTRKFALINNGKGLVEEPSPITPWLIEFLYKLLQWPGINYREILIREWKDVSNIGDLQLIIGKRLDHQRKIYGKLSRTPVYTLPVSRHLKDKNLKLRFAVVQPLLPQLEDFNVKDPTSWSKLYREKHRDHLASICHLVNKQVKSTISAKKPLTENDNGDTFAGVDVIVFPELSVHPDDIELLRGLSDETNAHIFAGLTFLHSTSEQKPINQALWLLRSETDSGREFTYVYQGKKHMTKPESQMEIESYRPYQAVIELEWNGEETIRLAGAICYDATDLSIAADLRDVSDVFIISAMNKDIQTFDNMVSYLHYHMYQPVILANTGQFGGSTVQAPFSNNQRIIAHVHGNQQIAISIFEIDPSVFKRKSKPESFPDIKTPPAGYVGRN
ncbi:reverse transcriptase [Bacillus velezensis]|uniref:reverse transcriptase n=1 Tax=Bacillus velezensis TaxID=492670 RepID=UPI0015F4E3CB|nr:reverse transcriptase [Bacillus velezensis]QMT20931.1 reverse transcriptase [Bacillus velezensis]